MEILVGYGLVPQMERLLCNYWYRLTMVSQSGRYFGSMLNRYRGVAQVDLLTPTIFNMVVDAVIRHWGMFVSGKEVGMWGFDIAVQKLILIFSLYIQLLTSPQPSRIHEDLDVLTVLF